MIIRMRPVTVERMPSGRPRCYTSVGSYPLAYVMRGDTYCPDCAAQVPGGMDAVGVNWESDLTCVECEEPIPSAYGDRF